MSRRGRSRGGRYPYQGNKYSQHDNRSGRPDYDDESGEHRNFGSYNNRGNHGGGKFRGRGPRPSDPYARPDRGPARPQNDRYQLNKKQKSWTLIYEAAMLDQAWLIDALQRESMTQICPVQYYCDDQNASFCVDSYDVAVSIRRCSKQIETPDGNKLFISTKPCSPPITDAKMPILKEVLSERYNTDNFHLDASDIYSDKKLRSNDIVMKPQNEREMYIMLLSLDLSNNRLNSLKHLKRLVMFTPRLQRLKLTKNFLKFIDVLDDIKDWDLKELNIDENPLCGRYQSQPEYVRYNRIGYISNTADTSAVRNRFPNLEILDGKKLPPPVKFDLERVTKLVPAIPNHIPPDVQAMITQFVQQYFSLYDTDRSSLVQAYDARCSFSMKIPTAPHGPPLSAYYNHSRNLVKLKHPAKKNSYLRYPRSDVCSNLCELPGTEHDISGFSVDVPLMSANLLKFVIRGVFKEKGSGRTKDVTRAFSRCFMCLTDGVRLSIINDQLHVRNANSTEHRSAFAKPPVTPSPSPVPEAASSTTNTAANITSPSKMDMISAFAKESGMNAKYSEQCLLENQWDYARAGQAFLSAKEKGMIPPEAYTS